ncbi:MAG: thiamine diphosphokinase, partial [Ignavibacteria bacterium]|nr:thiamine diphosphokinase [Ignavibacteria bacterium]
VCNGLLTKAELERFTKLNKPRKAIDIIACDGASDFLVKEKVTPDIVIGDMDSASAAAIRSLTAAGVPVIKQASQDRNDIEKALDYAISEKYTEINVIGFTGKRFDHSVNNLSILLRYSKTCKLKLYDDKFRYYFVRDKIELENAAGTVVSLIPMPKAEGIRTSGLKYPLDNESLKLGKREGALNETIGENMSIRVKKGVLLVCVALKAK